MSMRLQNAGLPRRLAAMFYDALLVLAVWMVVTALLLPLTGGEAITSQSVGVLEVGYRVLLLAAVVLYFAWSWTRSGQTVGMLAWRLKLVREDERLPRWGDALRRLAAALLSAAPCGLGYLWIVCDDNRLAWHDRLSRTRIVLMPRR